MQGWARKLFVVELLLIGAPLFIVCSLYLTIVATELLKFDYYRLPEPSIALGSWIALLGGLRLSHRYLADPEKFGLRGNWLAWGCAMIGVLLLLAACSMAMVRARFNHEEFLRWYGHMVVLLWALPILIPFTHLLVAAFASTRERQEQPSDQRQEDGVGFDVPRRQLLWSLLGALALYASFVYASDFFVRREHLPALRLARLIVTSSWWLLGIGLLAARHWRVQVRSIAIGGLLPGLVLLLPAMGFAIGNSPAWFGTFCFYLVSNALLCASVRRFENALVLSLLVLTAQLLLDGLLLGELSHFSMKM